MKNNIIWILVDGIRNYHSVGDELARLPIMDKLAEQGIYFSNAVTSATSTAMSISSQHVGIPSAFLSRNFQDFKYDSNKGNKIEEVELERHENEVISDEKHKINVLMSKEDSELLNDFNDLWAFFNTLEFDEIPFLKFKKRPYNF